MTAPNLHVHIFTKKIIYEKCKDGIISNKYGVPVLCLTDFGLVRHYYTNANRKEETGLPNNNALKVLFFIMYKGTGIICIPLTRTNIVTGE